MVLENNQKEDINIDNDEISLKEIIIKIKEGVAFFKTKWVIILIAGIIGGSIGIIIAINEKPTYKAVLTFAMEEEKGGGLSGASGIASTFGIDLGGAGGGGAFAASNLTEFMKSRLIVEKALLKPVLIKGQNITLLEYYLQFKGIRKSWESNIILKNLQFLPNADRSKYTFEQDSVLKVIFNNLIDKNNLSITPKDKKITILSINVISDNEIFSKLFCENLAKETSDFYILTKSKKSRNNVNVLQKQVDSVRNELGGSLNGMATETDNLYNLNPSLNIKGVASKRIQVDVQANTSILSNLIIQLELAKISLRKETPLIQTIDLPILPLERDKPSKSKYLIIGGLLSELFTLIYLLLYRLYIKNIQ